MRKVTVGIPAYNEEKNIANLLKSIEGQAGGLVHEVIISDDSSDGTPEAVRKFSGQTRLDVVHLHHKKKEGCGSCVERDLYARFRRRNSAL